MTRILATLCAAAGLMGGLAAIAGRDAQAQTPPVASSTASVASCPRGPVSIYFASGAVAASPQAQALIGRIGDTASACQPDRVDLVARIDAATEGENAVSVALERLNTVAKDLVSRGLPAERIRVAALAATSLPGPALNQIDVILTSDAQAEEPAPAPIQPQMRVSASDAI